MTTDHRELVARAINSSIWHEPDDPIERDEIFPFLRERTYKKADAVLAALEPWLLPENMYHGWNILDSCMVDEMVHVELGLGIKPISNGAGPNLPAAIRAALEGDDDA